jgi:hypothetical protein
MNSPALFMRLKVFLGSLILEIFHSLLNVFFGLAELGQIPLELTMAIGAATSYSFASKGH